MSSLVGPRRWLVLTVLLLPLVYMSSLIARYAVDIPVQDEWSLVEDIEKASRGDWSLQDLVRSHNGHRIAIPRLIVVGLALATDWRADLPAYLGPVFAAGLLILVWIVLRRSNDFPTTLIAAAFIGGLVASPNQWENWLWGLQMHVFLLVLLVVGGLYLLATGSLGPKRLAGAGACAVGACLTQGSGLVLWPAGTLVLAARFVQTRDRRYLRYAGLWTMAGALCIVGYLAHLPGDSGAGQPSTWVFSHPVEAIHFVAAVVGHPLVAWDGAAYPPHDGGIATIVALLAFAVVVLLGRKVLRGAEPASAIFPLALMIWSVGVAAQIALGRASWGPSGALASRYVTLMVPFWLGLALLLASAPLKVNLRRAVLLALAVALAISARSEIWVIPHRSRLFVTARRALITGENRDLVARLHPELFQVDAAIPTLRRLRISVFREGEPVPVEWESPPKLMTAGHRRSFPIRVRNTGREGWSSTGDGATGGWVALASRWLDSQGALVAEGPHRQLERDLAPGESVELAVPIVAPDLPAGSYGLEISALQESHIWFPEPLRVTIELRR
jgi:hypothetical protein